jgi:lysyl-tRNA synthetase class 2
MTDLVKEKTGVDFLAIHGDDAAREAAAKIGCDVSKADKWGHCVQKAFELKVEKTLMQPTHVIDQPRDISPFAKAHQHDPRLTERYETICMGKEIANAFSELSDPIDQMSRFEDQLKQREMGDDEAERIDADYVKALEYGLPPTGGLGIGIDRLVMMLTGSDNIRDVILFPMLRPTGAAEE